MYAPLPSDQLDSMYFYDLPNANPMTGFHPFSTGFRLTVADATVNVRAKDLDWIAGFVKAFEYVQGKYFIVCNMSLRKEWIWKT